VPGPSPAALPHPCRTVLSFVITSVDGRGVEHAIGFFFANFVGSFAIGTCLSCPSCLYIFASLVCALPVCFQAVAELCTVLACWQVPFWAY